MGKSADGELVEVRLRLQRDTAIRLDVAARVTEVTPSAFVEAALFGPLSFRLPDVPEAGVRAPGRGAKKKRTAPGGMAGGGASAA